MAHDPRGCLFPSLGLCWETWSWAEQEASILSLNAVLVGPRVQSGGWALRGPGRQRGDLGESEPLAAGRDQSRGLRPWWTQRCAARMLLFGRTCCPAVSSFWGESHLLPEGTAPSGSDLETEGTGRQVLPWGLHVGKPRHGSPLALPWRLANIWGVLGRRPTSPLPTLPSPLPSQLWMPSKHPARPQKLTVNLGHLEGRVGVSSEQMKTGEQRRPVPRPGGVSGVGGMSLRLVQTRISQPPQLRD